MELWANHTAPSWGFAMKGNGRTRRTGCCLASLNNTHPVYGPPRPSLRGVHWTEVDLTWWEVHSFVYCLQGLRWRHQVEATLALLFTLGEGAASNAQSRATARTLGEGIGVDLVQAHLFLDQRTCDEFHRIS